MVRDAERFKLKIFFELKYKFMHMLELDTTIERVYDGVKVASTGGAGTESSMPIHLINLAESMANKAVYGVKQNKFKDALLTIYSEVNEVKEILEQVNRNRIDVLTSNINEYHKVLNEKLDKDLRSMIDTSVIADTYYLIVQNNQEIGGFATNLDGDMTGFFSLVKGYGRELFKRRLEYAINDTLEETKVLNIFCIGVFLKEFYEDFGFKVDSIQKWDDNFAPKEWNYEKYGKPDIYNMSKEIK